MKMPYWIIAAITGLGITACDAVTFPGISEPKETPNRPLPPPPTVPAGQIPLDTPPAADIPETKETPASPINTNTAPINDTPATETDGETAPQTPLTDTPQNAPSEFADITDLLTVNARRCAPTSAEASLTLAEIADARPAAANVTAQAVNGVPVTTAAFPGIVKMEPKRTLATGGISSGHCGATRIASNWFVTASHCLDDTYDEIDLISTQSKLTDPRAIRVKASASLCHAAYGGSTGQYANDVALIGISDEAAAAFSAVPIARFGVTQNALGPANYPDTRMAGWGITSFDGGQLSDTLLTTELTLVSSGPAAITVSSRENAGPCIGDSGGPLLIDEADGKPKVVGVLSVVEQNRLTGEFCKGTYNARYTNLQGYVGWIESVIGVCTASPELCRR